MKENFEIPSKTVIIALAMGLCLCLVNLSQAQTTVPLAKQRIETINGKQYQLTSKLKAIVLGNFTYGFNHTVGYPNLDSTISRIGKAEGWTVDRITSGNLVTAANLAKYQIFFANYISGFGGGRSGGLTAASQSALQDFVEVQGKGLFLQHSSGDSPLNNSWPWYSNFVHPCHYTGEAGAGQSASSGWLGIYHAAAKAHPIMQGIGWTGGARGPDSVMMTSGLELHTFDKAMSNPAITPPGWQGLLGFNTATCGTPNTCSGGGYNYTTSAGPNGWAISWTFPLKKGAIGYFMEGHDLHTMTDMTQANWDKFYKQFMYYLAGYDTAAVVSTVHPHQDMQFAVDASGITFHPESEAGVLISKPGFHVVTLYNMSGKKIREEKGRTAPVDYDFSNEVKMAKGLYVMRVAIPGASRTARFLTR